MFFKTTNSLIFAKLTKLIPQIQQISCAKFTNFITMNVSSTDQTWAHEDKLLNHQHIQALAFLQCNFKNHIVNKKGIEKFKQIAHHLSHKGSQQLLWHYWPPSTKKIAQPNRKRFYVMDKSFSLSDIMECQLMQNKTFDKIICFPKSHPLQLSDSLEKFCVNVHMIICQHNIKAMGLSEFTLRSLLFQISKFSKFPTLLHELLQKDAQIYKDVSGKNVPTELIIFMNKVTEEGLKNKNFPTFKQILKNYLYRQTFKDQQKIKTKDFSIGRFQHITEASRYLEAIQEQQTAMGRQDQE